MAGHGKTKTTTTTTTRWGLLQSPTQWLFEHQIGVSFNLILTLFLIHTFLPNERSFTYKFFTLSGYNPATGKYATSHDDLYFVGFCVVLFCGIRASSMQYVLAPFARYWGLTNKKRITRFAEQGWMFMYNAIFWTLGMYIYINSPYFLKLEELWTDWPQREMDGLTKGYVLAQLAYWTQQLLVVNLETRRHDYWQMIAHHVATTTLIASAYVNHHTRVSNLIFVLMDIIELIFPLAKCLKCLGFTTICDVIFGIFMVTWLVTRHIFYLMVCWSVYRDSPRHMPTSCYDGPADNLRGPFPAPEGRSYLLEPFRNPGGIVCMTEGIRIGFLSYLLVLQAIMIPWSAAIVRVAIQVLRGDNAEDVRSDDEEEEEVEEDEKVGFENAQGGIEEEVGAEVIDFDAWKRRSGVKQQHTGRSSGASISRHSDRKELLNRIGCERQIE
ncbi:longevity-assurance protein [Xylaria bambusicola]|uniref:longevity-assurance protein n=1 Tax=Xylaria bambusicola TaxID=326684 RepID=UPI0020088F74|nr:longevity-assurance protein [Xylaria bambusicola]KAI0521913.1 longevity-assurance protein [Xylaria bambusicola]